jgi:hypothetical protein
MAKHEHGEYIQLYDADAHYAKGHLTNSELAQAYGKYFESIEESAIMNATHQYAFWGVGYDEVGEHCQALYTRTEPGRGRFKVTRFEINLY